MKTRITTLALALLLLLSSCGTGNTTETEATTTETVTETTAATEPEFPPLPDVDMDGFTLSMLHHNDEFMTWCITQLDSAEMNGEMVNDAIYERNARITEKYNCKINVAGEKSINATLVSEFVMSGDTTYDIMLQRDYEISKSAPYILPWNDMPYIEFDEEWWYPEATDVFSFGDNLYAAANSISLACVSRASGFAFNKTVFEEMGLGVNMYDYVYDDNWTLDTFTMLATTAYRDLNGDGQMDKEDLYGIGHSSYKEVFARLINGSGVSLVTRDEEGYPVFVLPTDENAIDKMMKILELASDKGAYNNPDKNNADNASAWGDLLQNTSLFRLCHAKSMGSTLRDADIEYGFMPNPKYDQNQDRYYSTTWAFEIMTLPNTLPADRLENIGLMLEALARDSHTTVLEKYKEDAVKTKYAQDEDSLAMLDIAFKSISFDLGLVLWEGNVANPLILEIFAKNNGTVISSMTSKQNAIDKILVDFKDSLPKGE